MSRSRTLTILTLALGVAALPAFAQQYGYVTRSGADAVDVVDRADHTVVATIPVGDQPWGVAVHPQGHRAYTANTGADTVSVIDTASNLVVGTITVGDGPRHLAISPDGTELWVGNLAGDSVSIISTATDSVVDTLAGIDAAGAIAFEPGGSYAWVSALDQVLRIDTISHAVDPIAVVGTSDGIAVNPDGTTVYVARQSGGSSSLAVIDTDTLAVRQSGTAGLGQWGVAVHPNGRFYYVAIANRVRAMRTHDDVVSTMIAMPDGNGATGVSIDPEGNFLYVTNRTSGNLHVVSLATNQIVETIALGGTPRALGSMFAQPLYGQGSLAVGSEHACRLRGDWSVSCWGSNAQNEATAPFDAYRSIAAGSGYNCTISRTSGRAIDCWGDSSNGRLAAPGGQYMLLAAGSDHACAIRAAGSAACWGRNDAGQGTSPSSTNKFFDLASGGAHSCGVRIDGTLLCWGDDADGQSSAPLAMPGEHFVQVVAGADFSCALQSDGLAACWGNGADGRTNAPAGRFAELSTGANAAYACGRRFDGSLECWGADSSGETTPPAGRFALHAGGTLSGCAIASLGELECWGDNALNQAPQFTLVPATLADATQGASYLQGPLSVEIVDPGMYTYKSIFARGIVDGDLPPGLRLESNRIMGTPTSDGTYAFTVRAEDANGFHTERDYTITVN